MTRNEKMVAHSRQAITKMKKRIGDPLFPIQRKSALPSVTLQMSPIAISRTLRPRLRGTQNHNQPPFKKKIITFPKNKLIVEKRAYLGIWVRKTVRPLPYPISHVPDKSANFIRETA